MYRQGDILIVPVSEMPSQAKPLPRQGDRLVLAEGEVTGHAHAVVDELAELVCVSGEIDRWLRTGPRGATVTHEEHAPIMLPTGDYRVMRQLEYTPSEIQRVAD